MKKEVPGQFTFVVTSPIRSNEVLFVIPVDSGGSACPDIVLTLTKVSVPNPALSVVPELRQQAIEQAVQAQNAGR